MNQKSAFREIEPGRYLPTAQQLVTAALADIMEQNETLLKWIDLYKPLPKHLRLRKLYEDAAFPPEERDPPALPDPQYAPTNVQVFLAYGAARCLDSETFIPYCVVDSDGRYQNSKGGTIARLYQRFHNIGRYGKWGTQRLKTLESSFYTASVDAGGKIFRNRIVDVVYSGERPCLEIILADGRFIVATREHRFLTPLGFAPAGSLVLGSLVMIRPTQHKEVEYVRPKRAERAHLYVKHHPVAGKKRVNPKSSRTQYSYEYYRLVRARAVVEARMNSLPLDEYVERLNSGALDGLMFLPRDIEVHHRDEDFTNDAFDNLELMTQVEHARRHMETENGYKIRASVEPMAVTAIRDAGVRATYDIVMDAPLNNFVANGIVVHNSGKTNSAIAKCLEDMCLVPGLSVLVVRHTYDEINDTIFGDMKIFCGRYGIDYTTKEEPPELTLPNTSKIILRSSRRDEKPGQDKASSLQGMEFGAAILEEADRIPEYYFDTVITRLSQSGLPRPWILVLCNPPGKDHWIYERFFKNDPSTKRPRGNYYALHYPLEDNRHNLTAGYIENLERELSASPSRKARFFSGQFSAPVVGKALFRKYFRTSVHVKPFYNPYEQRYRKNDPPPDAIVPIDGVELWVGLDFGYVHPAVVVAQEDPLTLQIRVLWEYMGHEVMLEDFIRDVQRRLGSKFKGFDLAWSVDPHGRSRNTQTGKSDIKLLQELGISPRFKDLPVEVGLSAIATLLYTTTYQEEEAVPLLVIADTCVDLVDGFTFGYVQDPKKHIAGVDDTLTPYKDGFWDHLFDALRYIIVCNRATVKSRRPGNRKGSPRGKWMELEAFDEYGRDNYYKVLMEEEADGQGLGDRAASYGFGSTVE